MEKEEISKTVSRTKEQICEAVMQIDNEKFLLFLLDMINSFKKKWGI